MRIGDAESFVEFRLKEILPERSPRAGDASCSVEVSCNGFKGRVESVWFAPEAIDRFLSELETFERQRRGAVSLLEMGSPSDYSPLRFEIFALNDLGQLAVRADLLKTTYVGERLTPLKLSVTFALDAGMLRLVLEDFRELFSSSAPAA